MLNKKNICILFVGTIIIMIVSSYLFKATDGLLYIMGISESKIKIKYVSELLSSGSDDNMMIGLWDLFYIPIIIFHAWKCCFTKVILSLYTFIMSLQLISFLMIDAGSIYETVIYGENIILFGWFLFYLLSIILVIYSFSNFEKLSCKKLHKS